MADSETKPEPRHDEASGDGKETRFYPLDATDLPFARYEHSGLTERDLMVHNIMACYMNPSRPKPSEHRRYATCPYATCDDIQHDINVIRTSLFTFGDCKLPDYFSSHSSSYFPVSLQGSSSLCPPSTEIFLDSVMRHYLEIDDSAMRAWIADTGHRLVPRPPLKRRRVDRRSLDVDSQIWESFVTAERAQLVQYRSLVESQADARLYSGGMFAPIIRRGLDEFDIGVHGASRLPSFTLNDLDTFPRSWDSAPVWPEGEKWSRYMLIPVHQHRSSLRSHLWRPDYCIKDFNIHPGRGRNRDGHWSTARTSCSATADGRYGRERRRCSSLPPEGSFASAILPASLDDARRGDLTLIFSRMKVSQLDRRSRRRSLSRTRIEELFDWDVKIPNPRGQRPPPEPGPRCHNCVLPGHQHTDCPWPCGHCGTTSRKYYEFFRRELGKVSVKDFLDVKPHAAPDCPVSPKNRCKCIAFPTYHTAKDCRITCHRDCGNPAVPGSLRHRSAMLCKSRCCMCGIRGHNGKECTNKTCRCGGHHLGQDCCWNPTCRVKGCDRYLCGVHCRECGSVEGRPFKDRRCWRCHGADGPFDWTKHRPRRTKKDHEQPGPVGRGEHVAEPLAEKENTTEQSVTIMPPPKIEPVTTVPKNTIFNNSGWSFSGITNGESSRI